MTSRARMMSLFRTKWSDLKFIGYENYTSFSIVRHPFERLVSAYYDFSNTGRLGDRYKLASFEVFARDLIRQAKTCWPTGKCLNPHFLPFSTACNYCENRYRGKLFIT